MTIETWENVKPGATVTVKHLCRTRSFKLQVTRVEVLSARGGYAFITGTRLRMDGTRSTVKANAGKGLRRELVHLADVLEMKAPPRQLNADGRRARGSSNGNHRGNNKERKARKLWLLGQFGDGEKATCAFNCGAVLTIDTITVDRYPLPGAQGGTYARGNIRPACGPCNSRHGATVRRAR